MPNKALVVGISKYLPPTPELTAPALEAEAWAALLPVCGISDVTVIRPDSSATLGEVSNRLMDLFRDAKRGEQRVFVYCGHGTIVGTARGIGEEALQLFHPSGTKADAEAAALTDSRLTAILKAAKPSPETLITIIIDGCFSGGFDVRPPASQLLAGAAEDIGGPLLSSPLMSTEALGQLQTVHRFASLWDRGAEFAAIDPLVVAACERLARAAELTVPRGAPPHLAFSASAIPALQAKPLTTHEQLRDAVNRIMSGQRAVLLGNTLRHPHSFFS